MNTEYMSGPHDGEKCACKHDGARWIKRCAAAAANDRKEAARSAADTVRVSLTTTFTPEFLALAVEGGWTPNANEDLR